MKNLNKEVNLKSEISIKKCLEYSENEKELMKIIDGISVFATFKGLESIDENSKETMKYKIEIKRNKKSIKFDFYQSINFTEIITTDLYFRDKKKIGYEIYNPLKLRRKQKELKEDFLYSVLCCVKSDSYVDDNFQDFCDNFGYIEDSRKHYILWERCLKQKKKILSIFNMGELENFPD